MENTIYPGTIAEQAGTVVTCKKSRHRNIEKAENMDVDQGHPISSLAGACAPGSGHPISADINSIIT